MTYPLPVPFELPEEEPNSEVTRPFRQIENSPPKLIQTDHKPQQLEETFEIGKNNMANPYKGRSPRKSPKKKD